METWSSIIYPMNMGNIRSGSYSGIKLRNPTYSQVIKDGHYCIGSTKVKDMAASNVDREYYGREDLREEVHESHTHIGDDESLVEHVHLNVSLLIDGALESLSPRIEL
jgi:hypothetical protein